MEYYNLLQALKHMAGRHDQSTHGHSSAGGAPAAEGLGSYQEYDNELSQIAVDFGKGKAEVAKGLWKAEEGFGNSNKYSTVLSNGDELRLQFNEGTVYDIREHLRDPKKTKYVTYIDLSVYREGRKLTGKVIYDKSVRGESNRKKYEENARKGSELAVKAFGISISPKDWR